MGLSDLKGKAIIVAATCLGQMVEQGKVLKVKALYPQVQHDLIEGWKLPGTKPVFLSNVLSKLALAGCVVKTDRAEYFMTLAQEREFEEWRHSDAYQVQLSTNVQALRSHYQLEGSEEESLADVRKRHAKETGISDIKGSMDKACGDARQVKNLYVEFAYGDGKCNPAEYDYVQAYQEGKLTRGYVPKGWTIVATDPKGVEWTFEPEEGRIYKLSGKKGYATIYSVEE